MISIPVWWHSSLQESSTHLPVQDLFLLLKTWILITVDYEGFVEFSWVCGVCRFSVHLGKFGYCWLK